MDLWNRTTLKSLLLPGSALLMAAAVLLGGGFLSISGSAIDFYYYTVFIAEFCLPGGSIPAGFCSRFSFCCLPIIRSSSFPRDE